MLVTGASGFLGKHMVRALAANGWAVRAAARDPTAIPEAAGVERVALPDLARNADWAPLVDGAALSASRRHRACAGHLPEDVYNRINRDVVGELADAARGRVERFVLMSTVRAQAGLAADHVITEADPPLATDVYGSKLEAEQLLAESGVPFSVLRPAVVYGRGVKAISRASPRWRRHRCRCSALDNRRSLLAIDNLASAIEFALVSQG